MCFNLRYRLVHKLGYFIASLPIVGNLCYKLAQAMVRCYDNDGNHNRYSNGEYHLLKYLLDRHLLKTVFDVGANIGDYSAIIASQKTGVGKIYAFDPRDSNVETLRSRFSGMQDVSIVQTALSDKDGRIDFYQNSDPSQSGTDSVHDMAKIGYSLKSNKISVACKTIDQVSIENHIDHINLLKIDVEGHELSVLKGAKRMLSEKNIDYIQFEFGHAARVTRVLLLDIVVLFHTYGYNMYLILPKGLKPFTYSPWEENRYNIVNFLAVSNSAPDDLNDIVIKRI